MSVTSLPARLLLPAAARAVRARRLLVLCYHRVLPSPDPFRPDEIDQACFDEHLAALTRHFNVVSLGAALAQAALGPLPERSIALTFDDGYADNAAIALPILQRYGASATVFVTTGYLDGGLPWNEAVREAVKHTREHRITLPRAGMADLPTGGPAERLRTARAIIAKIRYLPVAERAACVREVVEAAGVEPPRNLMLSRAQVRELAGAGVEIGAHTLTHPILSKLDDEVARREIADSRRTLEEIVGARVTLFAYPNGRPGTDYDERHVAMVKEAGFAAAVSTEPGLWSSGDGLFEIPRYAVWREDAGRFAWRLLRRFALNASY